MTAKAVLSSRAGTNALSRSSRRSATGRPSPPRTERVATPVTPGGDVPGRILYDRTLPASNAWARVIPQGQALRIVDIEGQQAVDFLCYDARNPVERYNAADTMKYAGTVRLTKGHSLYSDMGRPLFRIIEDTCGSHDTIFGCCSAQSNWVRYGVKGTPNCRDNFVKALRAFGLGRKDIVPNVNFFMDIPIEPDGRTEIKAGPSKAGDFVDLIAERDTLAVVSNCPQTLNAANNFRRKPIRLLIWQPKGGQARAGQASAASAQGVAGPDRGHDRQRLRPPEAASRRR